MPGNFTYALQLSMSTKLSMARKQTKRFPSSSPPPHLGSINCYCQNLMFSSSTRNEGKKCKGAGYTNVTIIVSPPLRRKSFTNGDGERIIGQWTNILSILGTGVRILFRRFHIADLPIGPPGGISCPPLLFPLSRAQHVKPSPNWEIWRVWRISGLGGSPTMDLLNNMIDKKVFMWGWIKGESETSWSLTVYFLPPYPEWT